MAGRASERPGEPASDHSRRQEGGNSREERDKRAKCKLLVRNRDELKITTRLQERWSIRKKIREIESRKSPWIQMDQTIRSRLLYELSESSPLYIFFVLLCHRLWEIFNFCPSYSCVCELASLAFEINSCSYVIGWKMHCNFSGIRVALIITFNDFSLKIVYRTCWNFYYNRRNAFAHNVSREKKFSRIHLIKMKIDMDKRVVINQVSNIVDNIIRINQESL